MNTRSISRQRLRRRSRARGAVLVESLIVSSMLILMLVCALFFHRLYSAKLRSIREARFFAWQAVNARGCGSSGLDLQEILSQAVSALRGRTPEPTARVGYLGVHGTTTPPSFFGAISHRVQTATRTVSSHPLLGGGSYRAAASDQVACNESPSSARGDLLSVYGFAARNVIGPVWGTR